MDERLKVAGCALTAEGLATQRERYVRLAPHVASVDRGAAGVVVRFAPGYDRAALDEVLAIERECCPFFRFELIFAPDHSAIWLHLGGGPEVKEFIAASRGMAV